MLPCTFRKKREKKKEMSGIGRRILLLKMSWSKVVKAKPVQTMTINIFHSVSLFKQFPAVIPGEYKNK